MKAFLKTVAQDMLAKYGTNMSDIDRKSVV